MYLCTDKLILMKGLIIGATGATGKDLLAKLFYNRMKGQLKDKELLPLL